MRFFDPKGKKLKNLGFLSEIFPIQTQTKTKKRWLTRPNQQKFYPTPDNKNLTQPRQKFDPGKLTAASLKRL